MPKRVLVTGLALYAVLSLVSMATMSIGAVLLLGCLVYYRVSEKGLPKPCPSHMTRSTRLFAGISLFFVAACLLSLVVAKLWPLTIAGHVTTIHFGSAAAKLWYFVWPFVLWHALELSGRDGRKLVLKAWLGTFFALSVLALFQHFYGWPRPLNIPTDPKHFHATLFLGHHLSVASIFIFPFFAWLDIPGIPRGWRIAGGVIGFIALMFTYSRTLWVALPVGLVFWAFLRLGKKGKISVILALIISLSAAYQVPQIHRRFTDLGGVYHREDLWEANWHFFEERPLTGVGLKQNEELSGFYLMEKLHTNDVFQGHAHNDFLDILSSTGALGMIGFLAWWIFLTWVLVVEIKRKPGDSEFFGRGLLAALLVYQINGLTQVNFWEGKVQHQLMWMVAWILLWRESCSES